MSSRSVGNGYPVPGPGLALVPAEHAFPVGNVRSAGQRLPAMVMKYVIVAGFLRCPAQVEGQVVRAGDQPPDQQVVAGLAGLAVAIMAQSLMRGSLDPAPDERCSNTVSLTTSSALITTPDGRVIRKSLPLPVTRPRNRP